MVKSFIGTKYASALFDNDFVAIVSRIYFVQNREIRSDYISIMA